MPIVWLKGGKAQGVRRAGRNPDVLKSTKRVEVPAFVTGRGLKPGTRESPKTADSPRDRGCHHRSLRGGGKHASKAGGGRSVNEGYKEKNTGDFWKKKTACSEFRRGTGGGRGWIGHLWRESRAQKTATKEPKVPGGSKKDYGAPKRLEEKKHLG